METFFTPEQKKWLSRAIIASVILFALFMALEAVSAVKQFSYIGRGTADYVITVTGKGEVVAIPNIATFSFSVSENAKTTAEAQNKESQKVNAAISVVKSFGIADTDIKTLSYNSYPTYSYTNYPCPLSESSMPSIYPCRTGKQTITGYQVSQTIEVKVRIADTAGEVLAKIGGLGVSDISGLSFTVDNPEALQAEARGKAIADARAKANDLSKSLGVRLSKVVNFQESGNQPTIYAMEAKSNQSIPQIPTGENSFVSNVSVTYEVD